MGERNETRSPATSTVSISVDNGHCHLFGICQQEAPDLFDLGADGRLRYRARPGAKAAGQAHQAARCCPMQAITVTGGKR